MTRGSEFDALEQIRRRNVQRRPNQRTRKRSSNRAHLLLIITVVLVLLAIALGNQS